MTWADCSFRPVRSVIWIVCLSAILQCRDLRLCATPPAQPAEAVTALGLQLLAEQHM